MNRIKSARVARVVAAALMLVALLPAAASAAPSPDRCASNRVTIYSGELPAGLRAPGTHAIQWRSTYTDAATGQVVVDDSILNQVTIDAAAPAYPNTVLVRLFRNTALLHGNEVVGVDAIQPAQAALLHVQVSWLTDEKFFTGAFVVEFRYQTKNKWSDYQALAAGPVMSFCVETNSSIWHRQYGWS